MYEYVETKNKQERPDGDGWEYWGDRITPDEHVAVWRRMSQDDPKSSEVKKRHVVELLICS